MPPLSNTNPRYFGPFTLLSLLACGDGGTPASVVGSSSQPPGSAPSPAPSAREAAADFGLDGAEGLECRTSAIDASSRKRSPATCEPSIPAQAFSAALCSCEDISVAGFLRTRSFRSNAGEQSADRLGGNVQVNRSYLTTGLADVGGSFEVAGARDVLFGGVLRVGEDLRFNPAFDVAGIVQVGRDAALGSSLRAVGRIDIGRDLYRAPESRFLGLALVGVGGQRYSQAVAVAPPCGCGASEILDIPALVAEARASNDNASAGLDSHELDLALGIGTLLTLPSGRYHLHQLAAAGALELRMEGRVSLFVDDDFYAGPLLRVSLAPGAELDLFVEDNFTLAGAAVIGDPKRPAATRVYVGGTGDIAIAGLNVFAGNVYAPRANVLVGGVGRVLGSLFGKNIVAAGFLDVGYDESVRDGNPICPPPGSDGPGGDEGPDSDPPGGEPAAPPCAPGTVPNVR
ncbi:MAG: hypothetical protein RL033_6657 [Pseudomonadota bacterium]|jgi:hypothetical protein